VPAHDALQSVRHGADNVVRVDACRGRSANSGSAGNADCAQGGLGRCARRVVACLCQFRPAEVPTRLCPLRLCQPGRTEGWRAVPAQPRPAHQLRQVQLLHPAGQRAGGRAAVDAGAAGGAVRRRAANHVRPAGRGDAGGARPIVDHLQAACQGALQQRRCGDRRGREVQLRFDVRPLCRTQLQQRAGRRAACRGAGCAHPYASS